MDIVKIDSNGKRLVVKTNANEEYFFSLMKRAKQRFGLFDIKDGIKKEGSNPLGMQWKNAHKLEFSCNGMVFRYEWAGDIDLSFL